MSSLWLVLVLAVIGPQVSSAAQCQDIPHNARLDCNPDEPISTDVCHRRGCCWLNAYATALTNISAGKPSLNVPTCFFGPDYVGYEVKAIDIYDRKTQITLNRKIASGFPKDSQTVVLEITELDDYSVRLKFYDPNQKRYEVPLPVLDNQPKQITKPLYKVNVDHNGILEIVRQKTSKPVFKTDLKLLIFSDQYLQLTSDLPSDYIYGLGEQKAGFRKSAKEWKRYWLFNSGKVPHESENLYGSHPFYLSVEDSMGNSNGVFLFNSNSMDVIVQPKPAITWRTIGGILDFYVFLGPQPKDVAQEYIKLIGLPHMPPYWAFGFQLCKYDYKGVKGLMEVFNRTRKAGIPYDVQWTDIDALDGRKEFTYDPKNWADLPKFVSEIHQLGMKYVPIFEPGVSTTHGYHPYDLGQRMDIFIKNASGKPLIGRVWPGNTVFPDFTDPKSETYWKQLFEEYQRRLQFDGAWLDMNEPAHFGDGSNNGCPKNSLEDPQYTPGPGSEVLRHQTICMSARQKAGLHYDLHNLYAIFEAKTTAEALKSTLKKRPFIISRSTSPGQGRYSGHWDGDVVSSWDHMRWTIPSILNFNMFGIPLTGADICGFNGNTNEELCARWSALGAFYPFSRNHNCDSCKEQDPAVLGPRVTAAAKNALQIKYSLLPYLYTLFFRAHTIGETVVRPLFFEFPSDGQSREVETQFMWGSALMVVPTLEEKATSVDLYIPFGVWYDWKTHIRIQSTGQTFRADSPLTEIKLVIRSGNILVIQEPRTTTQETRNGNFEVLVALDENSSAKGSLFWDSGDGIDNIERKQYDLVDFLADKNVVQTIPTVTGYDLKNQVSKVVVLGVKSAPKNVVVNGKDNKDFKFEANISRLTIDKIGLNLLKKNTIEWN